MSEKNIRCKFLPAWDSFDTYEFVRVEGDGSRGFWANCRGQGRGRCVFFEWEDEGKVWKRV